MNDAPQRSPTGFRRILATVAAVAVLTAGGAAIAAGGAGNPPAAEDGSHAPGPVPRPGLSPREVVEIQLEALRHNDVADRGIEVCFRFASPANRRATGPLARFAQMIKRGPYALMLAFEAIAFDALAQRGDQAVQRVTLVGHGDAITYVFRLSRQHGGPCAGCWMTDAVLVEPSDARPA